MSSYCSGQLQTPPPCYGPHPAAQRRSIGCTAEPRPRPTEYTLIQFAWKGSYDGGGGRGGVDDGVGGLVMMEGERVGGLVMMDRGTELVVVVECSSCCCDDRDGRVGLCGERSEEIIGEYTDGSIKI